MARTALSCFVLFTLPLLAAAQVSAVRLVVHAAPLPSDDKNIFVAGSFNNWQAGDTLYRLKKIANETYALVLPVYKGVVYQYKYNLGQWSRVEKAANGADVPNRTFVAHRAKKKITDSVVRWNQPVAEAKRAVVPAALLLKKDSLVDGLKNKLTGMVVLLKEYTFNLLQDRPNAETEKRLSGNVVQNFAEAFEAINRFFNGIAGTLTPAQKGRIRQALNSPEAEKDFINTLLKAVSETVTETPAAPAN